LRSTSAGRAYTAAETIGMVNANSRWASGCLNRTITVFASGVSTAATSSKPGRQLPAGSFGSRTRSIVYATSLEVTGEPSSHFAFGSSRKS
jgi:hypothetical protein